MNRYEPTVQLLIAFQWLIAILAITVSSTIRRQARVSTFSWSNPLELNRVHRTMFPRSPLRWIQMCLLALVLPTVATAVVFIHKNSVQNHAYTEQVYQQNQQLILRAAEKVR